jgi:hypothetical protein
VLGGGDSGGSGGGGGDSCGSGSGGGDSCGSGSGSGGGDSCGSGVSRFFGIVSAADADGNGSADGGQSDRRISAAADSAAAAEDVLVHIDGRELYATNHIEAERSVMAALGRCDALVFLWSFGGYWFPHSELERWLDRWRRVHAAKLGDARSDSSATSPATNNSTSVAAVAVTGDASAHRLLATRPVFVVGNQADRYPRVLASQLSHAAASSFDRKSGGGGGGGGGSLALVDLDRDRERDADFFKIVDAETFEEATSVWADAHLSRSTWHVCCSYLVDLDSLDGRALVEEARHAAKRCALGQRSSPAGDGVGSRNFIAPVYCSARENIGVGALWQRVRDEIDRARLL